MGSTKLRRVATALVGAILVALAVTGCSNAGQQASTGGATSSTASASKEPIKIGAVISLTGSYAGLGAGEKAALDMEVKKINDAGGINGRPIDLIIEDDATDAAKAEAAATKLIQQDKVVALIGATGTGQTVAMRGDVDRAGIPQVSMAGGTAVTKPLDKLVYQTPWSNSLVVPFELAYMQKAGIKKIALIGDSGGFGKDGMAVFAAEAPKYGMTVVSSQTFNLGDTDMTAQLTKIKAAKPDGVVLVSAGKEAATVAKNKQQLGITAPLYGTHGNARAEFITGAGSAAEGFKFAAGKILLPATYGAGTPGYTVAEDFITRFKAATGKAPDTFAGHAYDAINIIAAAARSVGADLTPATLNAAIEKTTGYVGIGGTFNYTPTDHTGLTASDLIMYEIKDGKWQQAQ
jgi:branched-chain amino acid transport system substrate-binding protein